ncbi:T-complex protein 1 subunit delta, partial [Galemys pyrenaicus]
MDNQVVISAYVQMNILSLIVILHYISNKMKIMMIKNMERGDVEFIMVGTKPVVYSDHSTGDLLGSAELAEESLLKKRALIAGGSAPERALALWLTEYSQTLKFYCAYDFANAMENIPATLAENAVPNPICTITELGNGMPRER